MKSHGLRWLNGLLCLGLLMTLAMTAGTNPALAHVPQQTPLSEGQWWLSFDGSSEPVAPALTLLSADANAIDLAARTPGCLVETVEAEGQSYSRLSGTGYGFAAVQGRPDLPILRRDVEIPFGAEVTLELVQAQYTDHALTDRGLSPIYPLQPPVSKSPAAQTAPLVKDQDFYANGARYPQSPVALGESYIVRGHRVQTVEVWPVAYDPSAGTVRLYSTLTVRLRLTGSDMARTQAQAERYASPAFDARLSRDLLNYNQGRPSTHPDSLTTDVGYLIITADAYYAAMQPFVTLKQSRGFTVTITKLSDIPATTNAQIKAYIQNAYDTWPTPPSYVLLVGDTDTMPGWNSVSAGEITDLYYGCMDGSSDWHPDIGRGRFPVRSAAQTTIMVNKYLAYASLVGTEPWLKKIAFPATCDQYTVAEGTHNYVINTHTLPNGYTGRFPNNPQPGGDKLYCITYNATSTDIQAAVNEGRWAVIYSGHGSWTGWEMSYGQTQVRNLTSTGIFPFVVSHACITGDFDQMEVYGETWVLQDNKGALAFWGSSDSSYWDEDDVLERAMFDSLFTPTKSFADVATMTDAGLAAVEAAYSGSARYYWETYNVLGDPAVKIFMEPDLPTFTLTVDPAEHALCASGSVTSTVTIQSVRGYTGTVDLDAGALPAGISAAFAP
ncbi:MAG: hypothetical protein KJ734_08200, partial [Chloroflexi bacterium]|nr:hypothetical protein [Chloroflexota bacterium]